MDEVQAKLLLLLLHKKNKQTNMVEMFEVSFNFFPMCFLRPKHFRIIDCLLEGHFDWLVVDLLEEYRNHELRQTRRGSSFLKCLVFQGMNALQVLEDIEISKRSTNVQLKFLEVSQIHLKIESN